MKRQIVFALFAFAIGGAACSRATAIGTTPIQPTGTTSAAAATVPIPTQAAPVPPAPMQPSVGSATPAPCAGCKIWDHPPYTFPTQTQSACAVTSITRVAQGTRLPPSEWSNTAGKTVSTIGVPSAGGVDQLIISDVAPDGSKHNPVCLSCNNPAAPPVDRFKWYASLRPQGDWILLDVENPDGPVITQNSPEQLQVGRNNGYWSNLWATTPDGKKWYPLTHFTPPPGGTPGEVGIMSPRWSPDGKRIVFTETYKLPDPANLQGYWHLYIGDFNVDSATGIPSLAMTQLDYPGDVFYETQDFSPDGTQLIVQSYTPGINAYGVDLYTINLIPGSTFGHYTNITNSPYSWDEHAVYSPDGKKIAWISSLPFPNLIPQYGNLPWWQYRHHLHNEVFLMNADGTDVQQLTRFNTPGAPEYTPQFGDVMFPEWNRNGTQLVVYNGIPEVQVPGGNSAWMVNFAGACGGHAK